MNFIYGKQDFPDLERGQETCWLLTNGLGGFSSQTIIGGAARCDHALLMSCDRPPNRRWNLLHRLEERLTVENHTVFLSSQQRQDGVEEDGWRRLSAFEWDGLPCWSYHVQGVEVEKSVAMAFEENTVAVRYTVRNSSAEPCTLSVTPWVQFVPKGAELSRTQTFALQGREISSNGQRLYLSTSAELVSQPLAWQELYYLHDARDGRRDSGWVAAVCQLRQTVPAGTEQVIEVVFSTEQKTHPAAAIFHAARIRMNWLAQSSGLKDPAAQQLAVSADAFLARRQSTGGKPF